MNSSSQNLVVGAGFEPAKLSRQIYSLIPLAAREPHQALLHYILAIHYVKPLVYASYINLTTALKPFYFTAFNQAS